MTRGMEIATQWENGDGAEVRRQLLAGLIDKALAEERENCAAIVDVIAGDTESYYPPMQEAAKFIADRIRRST